MNPKEEKERRRACRKTSTAAEALCFVAQGDSARDHSVRARRAAARVVTLAPGMAGTCPTALS